jgi:hypothetical protein
MKQIIFIFIFVMSSTVPASYESYDEIVDKLSRYDDAPTEPSQSSRGGVRSFSRAHIGLGIAQSFFDADVAGLDSRVQNQGGLIINLGVDLLSSTWGVEGSYTNFGSQNTDSTEINLREFSLKGLYKPQLSSSWVMRLGLGLSSRFLDISNMAGVSSYQTPSGLFLFGMDSYISRRISIGADLSFKTAMISDTIDQSSVDLSFRVDTHF